MSTRDSVTSGSRSRGNTASRSWPPWPAFGCRSGRSPACSASEYARCTAKWCRCQVFRMEHPTRRTNPRRPSGRTESSTRVGAVPRRRRRAPSAGRGTPAGTRDCPWDLFAQGRAPRPGPSRPDRDDGTSDPTIAAPVNPEHETALSKPSVQQQESVEHGESKVTDFPVDGDLTEAVERAEGLRAQIADLVQLVTDIQAAVTSRPGPAPPNRRPLGSVSSRPACAGTSPASRIWSSGSRSSLTACTHADDSPHVRSGRSKARRMGWSSAAVRRSR